MFLTARSEHKAQQTERLIKARVPAARIHWLIGDFSRLSDIDNIAREFLARGEPLDLLWLRGAETGLFLALDPSVQDKCGGYYFDCEQEPLQPYARDMEMAQTLWETSEQMVASAVA